MKSKNTSTDQDRLQRSAFTALQIGSGRSQPIEFVARLKSGLNINSREADGAEKRREIEFAHLPDGTVVDLIRDRSGELVFVVLQNGVATVRHTVKAGDIAFTPEFHSSVARSVHFPTAIGASHTPRELLREIEDVLDIYLDCDLSSRKLLAHFALYTWISDLPTVAVYIWVIGSYGCGKTTLLRVMSAICRRSILVGEISTPGLYTITTKFHPTLIIDECELGNDRKSRDFLRVLRVGSTRDQKVVRASGVYDPFGPKVIASRVGPADAALASRGFYIVARPLSRPVSMLTASALVSIAERLQPKLLGFRLNNYVRLKSVSEVPLSVGSSPRTQDIGRALLLPIMGDGELERQLVTIVEAHDQQAEVSRDGEPEWFVVIALLYLAHTRGPGAPVRWTAKLIGEGAQSGAELRGESFNLKPRKVGEILRSLGLNTRQLGSLGRGLESSSKLKEQIHEIAKRLGICAGDLFTPEFPDAPLSCTLCEKYSLGFDNTGRKLRFEPFSLVSPRPEDPENPTGTDE